ncbi:MAG: DMT family transporter, partial [Sterolibacteriaceae bacterium]|nr:DMT family transporter [Sterolibacteriaceae bacterium]
MQSLWMVAASLLFACMGVCVKLGAAQFSAAELVFWRGFIATLLIGGYIMVRRLPLATPHARTHVVRGLSGFVSLVMYFYAISMIPLAAAVTLNYTSPLFLALLLALWVKEPVRRGFYGVLAIGFVGVVFLLQPTLGHDQWLGAVFGLGSGIISSVAYLNVRRLGELGEPEWRTVFYFSAMATLGGLPWLLTASPFH